MTAPRLIKDPPPRLRQRLRARLGWRIWWEPEAPLIELGFAPVELDPKRLTWSVRQAEQLNAEVDARRSGNVPAPARAGERSFSALIRAYRHPTVWDQLRPATQKDYNTGFRMIEAKWGSYQVARFTRTMARDWYEALYLERGPSMALKLIRNLSILMSYAVLKEWRDDNPCSRLGLVIPKGRSRVASWDELGALLKAARDEGLLSMECAIALAVFQGQRQTDIIAAETAAFAKQIWLLRRSKRQNVGAFRLHPVVIPLVRSAIARAGDREQLLQYEGTARRPRSMPYNEGLFHKAWRRVRARAAKEHPSLATLQFRDLRRTFGHLSRRGGADPRDVGDALGNQAGFDPKLGEIYMPPDFETASRAVEAIKPPKGWRKGA